MKQVYIRSSGRGTRPTIYYFNVYRYPNNEQRLGTLLKNRFDCLINSLQLKAEDNISTIGRWKVTLK